MRTYYYEGVEHDKNVQKLFTKIANRYDLINDLQSLGLHRLWKHRLVSSLGLTQTPKILDLACGSGDLVFRILRTHPNAWVIGGDFTWSMLQVASKRSYQFNLSKTGHPDPEWLNLNGLSLPFQNEKFDTITVAYGLRNMKDPKHALSEIFRVLKMGGKLAILDFGKPRNPLLRSIYFMFLKTIQPMLGWIFFREKETYRYIYESLVRYPAQEGINQLLKETGFQEIRCDDLALGTMSLHVAIKKE